MNLLKIYEAVQNNNKWSMGKEIGTLKLNYDDQSHKFKFHESVRTLHVQSERDPFKNCDYSITDASDKIVGTGHFLRHDGETFIHLKMNNSGADYLVHVHTKSSKEAA